MGIRASPAELKRFLSGVLAPIAAVLSRSRILGIAADLFFFNGSRILRMAADLFFFTGRGCSRIAADLFFVNGARMFADSRGSLLLHVRG